MLFARQKKNDFAEAWLKITLAQHDATTRKCTDKPSLLSSRIQTYINAICVRNFSCTNTSDVVSTPSSPPLSPLPTTSRRHNSRCRARATMRGSQHNLGRKFCQIGQRTIFFFFRDRWEQIKHKWRSIAALSHCEAPKFESPNLTRTCGHWAEL